MEHWSLEHGAVLGAPPAADLPPVAALAAVRWGPAALVPGAGARGDTRAPPLPWMARSCCFPCAAALLPAGRRPEPDAGAGTLAGGWRCEEPPKLNPFNRVIIYLSTQLKENNPGSP